MINKFGYAPIYVASRASLAERPAMWRRFRNDGARIVSSWIDEAGEGETASFDDLWDRVRAEIGAADVLVLYAETCDFPLKGALVEVGMALALRKVVIVALPGVALEPRSFRPLGSWCTPRNVVRIDDVDRAMVLASWHVPVRAP